MGDTSPLETIIPRILDHFAAKGEPYVGVLYAGSRAPYPLARREVGATLSQLEEEFAL